MKHTVLLGFREENDQIKFPCLTHSWTKMRNSKNACSARKDAERTICSSSFSELTKMLELSEPYHFILKYNSKHFILEPKVARIIDRSKYNWPWILNWTNSKILTKTFYLKLMSARLIFCSTILKICIYITCKFYNIIKIISWKYFIFESHLATNFEAVPKLFF